jgi:hypothetical protein
MTPKHDATTQDDPICECGHAAHDHRPKDAPRTGGACAVAGCTCERLRPDDEKRPA